jgi:hypothetical protein
MPKMATASRVNPSQAPRVNPSQAPRSTVTALS